MENKEFDYINVIPLVDIMLVLLTIVLVTATFIQTGYIPVKLPEAKRADTLTHQRAIELSITKEGKILWGEKVISLSELRDILSALSRDTTIILNVDREARAQSLISVLDLFKELSFTKISLRTLKS